MELSETEQRVLRLLVEDSNRSFAEIGKKLGLSRQAVAYNVSSLRRKGVIKRFTVDIDYRSLGIGLPVMVFVKTRHVNIESFKRMMEIPALQERDNIKDVFTLSGGYSFGVLGWWRDKEDYGLWKTELIDELNKAVAGEKPFFELDEIVIWDFYKHRGLFEIPSHISSYLKERNVEF